MRAVVQSRGIGGAWRRARTSFFRKSQPISSACCSVEFLEGRVLLSSGPPLAPTGVLATNGSTHRGRRPTRFGGIRRPARVRRRISIPVCRGRRLTTARFRLEPRIFIGWWLRAARGTAGSARSRALRAERWFGTTPLAQLESVPRGALLTQRIPTTGT